MHKNLFSISTPIKAYISSVVLQLEEAAFVISRVKISRASFGWHVQLAQVHSRTWKKQKVTTMRNHKGKGMWVFDYTRVTFSDHSLSLISHRPAFLKLENSPSFSINIYIKLLYVPWTTHPLLPRKAKYSGILPNLVYKREAANH